MKPLNYIISLILLLAPATTWAQQTYTIKGQVVDSLTKEGEAFAAIKVAQKNNPSKAILLSVADSTGHFTRQMEASAGQYIATFSSTGKKIITRLFSIDARSKEIDFGTITTYSTDIALASAGVKAKKPLIVAEVDKIGYSVEDDEEAKTKTALEMLRKVPLVAVDGDDNIEVNGSKNFKILINGKPSTMMEKAGKDVLKSLPAEGIKKIEVITNPGAKYDAEGVGGLLNIVMDNRTIEGYSATISNRASETGNGTGGNATVKIGKLTVSANYNFNYNNNKKSTNESTRENFESDTEKYLINKSTSRRNSRRHYGNLEASYEIDTLRLLTTSFGLWGSNNHSSSTSSTEMLSAEQTPTYSYKNNGKNSYNYMSVYGNVDYQRSFSVPDRLLTLSYKLDANPSSNKGEAFYSDRNNIPSSLELPDRLNKGRENTVENTFQVDYSTPFGKIHSIESGVKYIIRNNKSVNDVATSVDGNPFTPDESKASDYTHRNDILAAYLSYKLKYKKYTLRPGLRYEHTSQEVTYRAGVGENFSTGFNDVVPSLSIGFKADDKQTIGLNYGMRIYRPSIWCLNPFFDNSDPMYISQGNPDLKSEKTHYIEASYGYYTSKFNFNMRFSHSFVNNSIESVDRLVGEDGEIIDGHFMSPGALYSTYFNMGKNQSSGANYYVSWSPTTKIRLYTHGYASYIDIRSKGKDLHSYGWRGNFGGGMSFTLPLNLKLSVNGGGSTPYISLQGRGTGYYYYSLSLNKSFLKEDRLNIGLSASNFLEPYRTTRYKNSSTNYVSNSKGKYYNMSLGLSLSYRLGSLKSSVKKAERSIENDDVKGQGGE